MPTIRTFALGVALAVPLMSVLPTAGQAYTPEQQQACTPDAFRLCNSDIPDVDRVTACMIRNKAQLSPECARFFRPGPEPDAAPAASAGQPVNIRPASTGPVAAKKQAKPKPKEAAKPASQTSEKKPAKKPEKKPAKPST